MQGYKIKDLETLSGIKAHTLRMWEKRYDLLTPKRTETKVRLYDKDDIIRLLNISILYHKGWKISKIAACSTQKIETLVHQFYSDQPSCNTEATLLIRAMVELKCEQFNKILTHNIQTKGLEKSYHNCLQPFLSRIENLWRNNRITYIQKHFVFNLIRQKLIAETDNLPNIDKDQIEIVLFTPKGDDYEIDLLFYNYVLTKKRYRTLYLGTHLPTDDLKKTMEETQTKKLVISLTDEKDEQGYSNYLKEIRNQLNSPIYIGGAMVARFGLPSLKKIHHISELID